MSLIGLATLPAVLVAVIVCPGCGSASSAEQGTGAAVTAASTGALFEETTASSFPAQPCGPGQPQGCYTNALLMADLNADGNLDVVFANGGGHFVPAAAESSVVYFGQGNGQFTDVSATAFPGLNASHVRQSAVGDINGDGLIDVYLPGGYGLDDDQLFIQTSAGVFADQASALLPPGQTRSRAGGAHLADVDGDGALDLLVIDWGAQPNPDDSSTPASAVHLNVLHNDGTGHFTLAATLAAPGGSSATDVDAVDVNEDFALDIVLDNRNGQSHLYVNDGTGTFSDATTSLAFPAKQGGESISFNGEACDVNGDGHLDLFFDGGAAGLASHDTQVLMGDGTGKFTDETAARIVFEPTTDDNQVKCLDVDGDGDFDLLVASLTNSGEKLLLNDGTGVFTLSSGAFPGVVDPTLGIDVGDIDGDGMLDVLTGQGENPRFPWLNKAYRHLGAAPVARGPTFRQVQTPTLTAGASAAMHFAVSDSHTSETGQHVHAVGVAWDAGSAGHGVAPATFVGGDLYRAVLPAMASGTTVSLTPTATNARGVTATSPAISVPVSG